MATNFQQTGEEICERCEIPRAIGESRGYDICRTEADYASDGYPEPGQEHTWVRVTPPAAPLFLPMGVLLAEERAREMAVIAEAEESDRRVIDGVEYVVVDFDYRVAERQGRAIREGTFR